MRDLIEQSESDRLYRQSGARSLQQDVLQSAREVATGEEVGLSPTYRARHQTRIDRESSDTGQRLQQYVAQRPEQATLLAVATGAVTMALLRYLVRRRKSQRRGTGAS